MPGALLGERRQHVEAARPLHAHVGHDQVVAASPPARARSRPRRRRPPRPRSPRRAGSRTADRARPDRPRRPARASIDAAVARPARPPAARGVRVAAPRRVLAAGGPLARQADEERRPLPGLALDEMRAAQRRRQLPADRQAQAGALAAPLGRVERLEDAAQVVGRDAVAGVAHGDQHVVVRDRARLDRRRGRCGRRRPARSTAG